MSRIEIDYYDEIATEFVKLLKANIGEDRYRIKPLIGEVSSGLRTLIVNGYPASEELLKYSREVHKLHLDISIIVENKDTGKFEVIILEVKKVKNLGLSQLSQLIGYCLVSKSKFGILLNIDNSVSSEFSIILDSDKNLTKITRIIDQENLEHQIGVMVWNSNTQSFEYTRRGAIPTIPQLVNLLQSELS